MLDRFGKQVRVDWPRHHLVWIEAALTLRGDEYKEALNDIASMTCRSYAAIYCKASRMREEAKSAERMRRRMAQAIQNPIRPRNSEFGRTSGPGGDFKPPSPPVPAGNSNNATAGGANG